MRQAIDVIIQARLDSTRLPRKVLLPINEKALICHIVERVSLAESVRNIIIATTEDSFGPLRNALAHYPQVKFYVGSKSNVLERYYMAARMYQSRVVVRATGDNPLVCPDFLDRAVELHLDSEADLTHYLGIPLGTGVEVISLEALRMAYDMASLRYDKEHVTPYIYKNPSTFRIMEPSATGLFYTPDYMVTVDTQADLDKVRNIFQVYRDRKFISMEDVVHYFKAQEKEASLQLKPRKLAELLA